MEQIKQNNPLNPTPEISQSNNKNIILPAIVIAFVVVVLLAGGIFFWQQNIIKKQTADLAAQIVEKEDIEKKTCSGTWQNGICVKSTCVDSDVNEKPDDIYVKGTVTYTKENGIENVVNDECTGSNEQVNEMWCYESPAGSGNYVQGKMIYNCPKGCLDGACTK